MNYSLRLEFYSQLSEEYPDLSFREISPDEAETFFARAKSWSDEWDTVLDYIGTHECDILADCVTKYPSKISLQIFQLKMERIDREIEEEQANTWNYNLIDIDFESNIANVEWEPEETGPRVRFSNATRELVRAGYSQERLEEVIENVFEQEGELS